MAQHGHETIFSLKLGDRNPGTLTHLPRLPWANSTGILEVKATIL